jgi:hypothetical protein
MKLDEVIAALKGASNRLIKVEELTEPELDELQKHFEELRAKLVEGTCGSERHSIEELLAHAEHVATRGKRGRKRTGKPHHPHGHPGEPRPVHPG